MSESRGTISSSYMHWAKTLSQARFNLAASGLSNLPLRHLRVSLDDLEITNGGYGYEPLLSAIGSRYEVARESIVTAAGTSFANHLALAALIGPGDDVLFETPAYEPMLATAQFLGAKIRRFTRRFEEDFQVLPELIEESASPNTRLIVLTNLHNPSGVLTDDETLKLVGGIAQRYGTRVLLDEVYMETLFESRPRTSFHLGSQFVVTSSLTKTFGLSGLRCGWIFAEPALAKKMWRLNDLFASTPVHVGERLSVLAFQQIEEIGVRSKELLGVNRRIVNEFLDSRNDLEAVRPEFGTTMFPRLKRGNTEELCDVLKEKYETSVVPGRFFDLPDHFRIGFAGDTETLKEGLNRLSTALDELRS